MNRPKFKHDCSSCRFIGHYFDHDVYICPNNSIVARHGNDGHDYASVPVSLIGRQLRDDYDGKIGSKSFGHMNFHDYIFSEYVCPHTKAMILALSHHARFTSNRVSVVASQCQI